MKLQFVYVTVLRSQLTISKRDIVSHAKHPEAGSVSFEDVMGIEILRLP